MEHTKSQFVLKGFRQVVDCREFAFERVEADRTRSQFTVRADLALARRHQIPLQELPLLCRAVLDQAGGAPRLLVFTETDMRNYAAGVAARTAAAKAARRPARRPRPTEATGSGWRTAPAV